LPADVRVEGAPVELPPGVDVSAYRIVQENALKHAGPARASVIVRHETNALELEVLDDGAGAGGGSGHGLVGIHEHVGVYRGEVESGARVEGGFGLRVRLPLAAR
jgi:signal transduction histidine kinase